MREHTMHALNALNHAFYAQIADEWQASRKAPWPGFARVLDALSAAPRSVLDLGAGDGRFATFLSARTQPPHTYLGLDASEALLQRAQARALAADYRFAHADFVRSDAWQPRTRFALVVLFGVLHHVPSLAQRRQLVARAAACVEPGGCLALTFWRLDGDARFERRVLPLATYNATAAQQIAPTELEPGDVLLRWGQHPNAVRYCHFADATEIETLIAATQLRLRTRFLSDGRGDALNEYVLLEAA